jgi:hypothetical protein
MKTSIFVVGTRGAFVFAIATALVVGAARPVAAQMKKEGTFSGTFGGYVTCKTMAVGKERVLFVCDENGFTITDGFFDHMSYHCWDFGDFVKGVGMPHGTCVYIDPAGDQIYGDFSYPTPVALSQKSGKGKLTFTGGTGKYAGISGGYSYVNDFGSFRTEVPGTLISHATNQGNYKLP